MRRPRAEGNPSRPTPARTLRERGLRPKKALGQNFLADPAILDSIVDAAEIAPDDLVIEIGPGTGLLTRALAARAARVVAVELDRDLATTCQEAFAAERSRVAIVQGDALSGGGLHPAIREAIAGHARSGGRWRLVANLPYQIAAPALVAALESSPTPAAVVATIQREMADRLRAGPGTAAYGALGVRVQLLADVRVLRHLPPGAFWPAPTVRSSVVRCVPRAGAAAALAGVPSFDRVLRACFDYRRKRLATAIALAGCAPRPAASAALAAVGAAPDARGETLPPDRILALARALAAADGPAHLDGSGAGQ